MRWNLVLMFILLYAVEAEAQRGDKVTIEHRVFGANQIVHGRVLSTQSEVFRNQYGDELVITRARIQVKEMMKGEPADSVEMIVEKKKNSAGVAEGDEIIAFLEETPDGLEPHHGGLGILKLVGRTKRVRNSSHTVDSIREKVKKINLWQQAF